jgi:hypothetical protein
MQALLDAVVDLVALVSSTKVRTVAGALRGLDALDTAPSPDTLVGTPEARVSLGRVIAAWAPASTPLRSPCCRPVRTSHLRA